MVPGYDPGRARTGLAGLTKKPDPKDQAAQIVAWAICWPWNLVWTLCVHNPIRYVGEFLLKEIQSALFEISNGQFSSIEQDLTLAPPPMPYPIPEKRSHSEITSSDDTTETASAVIQAAIAQPPAFTTEVEQTEKLSPIENAEPAVEQSPVETTLSAEPPRKKANEELAATVEAELTEGKSSDSYTWMPPEPASFVPLSNRPLKAVRYESGAAAPADHVSLTSPVEPDSDPWFQKHTPS